MSVISRPPTLTLPDFAVDPFEEDKRHFPTPLQQFQFYDKYSRWDWETERRETWVETVDRSVEFLRSLSENRLHGDEYASIHKGILNMEVMPSMRLLSMAGPAAERNSLAGYNCSALPVTDLNCFVEAMLISMAGCGVGFSVESRWVSQLPRIKTQIGLKIPTFWVEDTTEGWGEAVRRGLSAWFNGLDIDFNTSFLRPKGAVLRVKGGRSSGPEVLHSLLTNLRRIVLSRRGQFLRSIDAHDMMCFVGDAAVSGGLRRTAMISIFDWDDPLMLHAKDPEALRDNPQRWNANNSAVWPHGITRGDVEHQMKTMDSHGTGEPGIFSRDAALATLPERRKPAEFMPNPCGEINLRPFGLCNLSNVIARPYDTVDSLGERVRIATMIGTIQSMATNFPGLRREWKINAEEERLLGVGMSGQMDCPVFRNPTAMHILRDYAVYHNRDCAKRLDIAPSAAVTCSKPDGNSSSLVDCAPGLTNRYSPYYIRRARVAATSPVYSVLRASGVPMTPENGQTAENATTWVVSFPVKSPEGAVSRRDRTAVDQCNYWLTVKTNWTEHNPSCTIGYDPHELDDLIEWVWEHREVIGGLSFLPNEQTAYEQAPYEEITEVGYHTLVEAFPEVDYSLLQVFEREDETTSAQEVACAGGACIIG